MIAVKVTCDTGNTWSTNINGSYSEACEYFMGKTFVREDDSGRETPDTVVSVELLQA